MFTEKIHRRIGTLALASALTASAPALAASNPVPIGVVPYTISGDFSEGCFGKCLCIVTHIGELEGSFGLREIFVQPPGEPSRTFLVQNVDMSIVSGTLGVRHYTGAGNYIIVNGIIVTHQLTLDLVDDKGAELHLDSGMIPGGEQFPEIGIPISHVLSPRCYGSWYDFGAVPTPNLADLNGDGVVNTLDLGILLSQWSSVGGPLCGPGFCPADFNHDGVVDSIDLGILLVSWTL